MQGLIGLIGGYVGLVLGCSFLQIPNMISSLVINLSKRKRKSKEIKRTRNCNDIDEVIITTSYN